MQTGIGFALHTLADAQIFEEMPFISETFLSPFYFNRTVLVCTFALWRRAHVEDGGAAAYFGWSRGLHPLWWLWLEKKKKKKSFLFCFVVFFFRVN